MPEVFNARAIHAWKPDRLYRIYWASSHFYFIRIAGQGYGVAAALEQQLGPLGALLGRSIRQRGERKLRDAIMQADAMPPEIGLRAHKHNRRVMPEEVVDSRILSAGGIATHGARVGRWHLELRSGERMKLQFEAIDDMRAALELLPGCLGDRLRVEVAWDPAAGQYLGRKSAPGGRWGA